MSREAFLSTSPVRAALAAAASLLALATAQSALAQTSADPAAAAPPSTTSAVAAATADPEEIVVTGVRRSLEDALAIKRQSVEIIDSLSAEGVGRLPDLNLAESLQRIPGVQINRSAPRRLGTISLRGLPGDFSQTLINGQYLASPDVTNFSFGTVRSEVFSGIDVIKVQSAKSLTGGLSGLVNLRTGDPMAAKDGIAISIDGAYEELAEAWVPGGAIVASRQLIPGVLAVRAAFGYKQNAFRIDSVQVNTYDRTAGAATADQSDDVFVPRQIRLPFEQTEGRSVSASAGVDWRPTETLKATLFGFYNDYTGDAYNTQYLIEFRPETRNAAGVVTVPGSRRTTIGDPTSDGRFGQTFPGVRIDNPAIFADSRQLDETFKTYAVTGNLEWDNETWRVGGTVHYTAAERVRDFLGFQAVQAPTAGAGNGFSATINTGAGNPGDFALDLNRSANGLVNLQQPFGAPIGPTFREIRATGTPGASFFVGFRPESEDEDELAFNVNVERRFPDFFLSSVEFGGVYRDKSQKQRQNLLTLLGTQLGNLNNSFYDYSVLSSGAEYFGGGLGQFDPADYAELNVRGLLAALTPANLAAAPSPLYIEGPADLITFLDSGALAATYDNSQKIYGGWFQLNFDQELAGIRLRGNAGFRYEKSERSTVPQLGVTTFDFEYDNWLPSANFIADLTDRLVFRASYTQTLRRPQVDQFAVLRAITVDGTGQLVNANFGATDLRPFTSKNVDGSLEFYNRRGSALTIAGFYKQVEDFAGTTRLCPTDGGGLGFGPLSLASGVCRTTQATPAFGSFPAVRQDAAVNINITANQDTFELYGFEASAQQNLDFLPAPWNGFGGQVNYTNVQFTTDSAFRLSELSQHTVNAIIYYETKRFAIRGAYNWRSEYFLQAAGTATGADRFVAPRSQLDLSGSLNINDRLVLSAEAFNITNEDLLEYEGAETRARNYTRYGRTFTFGLRYRLQ